jgi:hypothetical protein
MKIVLVEERPGQPCHEREFTSEVSKVGRDPIESHLVCDQSEWPMVSHRHAEFRPHGGRCLLADTSSKLVTVPAFLFVMFFMLFFATLLTLRAQDIG